MLSMPSAYHVCVAGDSMVVFNVAPNGAIAGCAKGEAMADTVTDKKLKDTALFDCDDENRLYIELFYS